MDTDNRQCGAGCFRCVPLSQESHTSVENSRARSDKLLERFRYRFFADVFKPAYSVFYYRSFRTFQFYTAGFRDSSPYHGLRNYFRWRAALVVWSDVVGKPSRQENKRTFTQAYQPYHSTHPSRHGCFGRDDGSFG